MSFVALAFCLTLLAYGVTVLAGSSLVLPFLRHALRTTDPAVAAWRLLALRLLPTALALLVCVGVVLPAFLRHEPRATDERVGLGLLLAAAVSSALLVAGGVRAAGGILATRRLVLRWRRTGRPIRLQGVPHPTFAVDEDFPIVAVAGCVRPELFLSRHVLARCTSAELAAIVAHETGHLRRRDPWSRFLLRACPDLLACTPLGRSLERSWEQAAEQAADDEAVAGGANALDLASALLAVARIAGERTSGPFPLPALYRGGGVAQRAARLLESRSLGTPRGRRGPGPVTTLALAASGVLLAVAVRPDILEPVHGLLEAVVLLFL